MIRLENKASQANIPKAILTPGPSFLDSTSQIMCMITKSSRGNGDLKFKNSVGVAFATYVGQANVPFLLPGQFFSP